MQSLTPNCLRTLGIKSQPYSVKDMLADDALAIRFDGGTVYQAFLSALSYHRWHSPVSGVVRKAYVVDGTYFSEPLLPGEGDLSQTIATEGISTAQGYLTALATRALIFIEADNPAIGLMVFIGIGWVPPVTSRAPAAGPSRRRDR